MKNKKQILQNLFLRTPVLRPHNLNPAAKKIQNQMTQVPKPLSYKLHPADSIKSPLIPLGPIEKLPFSIERSHLGNLPIYKKYRYKRTNCKTVIRHISGDVNSFVNELSKVVSNSPLSIKTGKVEVKGLHTESVSLWLTRLGF